MIAASRNIQHVPEAGQRWIFDDPDPEGEGQTSWLIKNVYDSDVEIVKESGKDIGYTTRWPLEKFENTVWTPTEASKITKFLWPCPDCGEDKNVLVGDYMCVDCRAEVDKPGENG